MNSWIDSIGARLLQTRGFVRAPIWLYRRGFGRALGQRILMLEHIGRTSGLPRYVCLEVVERPRADVLVVVSGFGTAAQWYRNLQAEPSCKVSIGRRRRVPAEARTMSEGEAAAALQRYRSAHPKAWMRLRGAIEKAVGRPVEALPMVELNLR